MKVITNIKVACATIAVALTASSVSAATYFYDTVIAGQYDAGASSLATLEVTSANAGATTVNFKLTNTGPAASWLDYLKFNTTLPTPTLTYTDTSPLDAWTVTAGNANGNDAGLSFSFNSDVAPNGSSNGLTAGNMTTWSISGATISQFKFNSPDSLLHIGEVAAGKSTKYTTSACVPGNFFDDCSPNTTPVPVPGGLPLMLTAIGVGAFLRRKSLKAA